MDQRLKHANALHHAGKLKEAEAIYNVLLNENEDDYQVLCLLGTIHLNRGHNGQAIALFRQAIKLKPDYADAFNNMGGAFRRENKLDKALKCFHKAIGYKEDSVFYNNMATLYINEGVPERALTHVERALALDPNNHHAQWNKALALLEQGKYREGFELYEYGLKTGDRIERNYEVPLWEGQPGKNVVVFGEQGIGDEIMFASKLHHLIRDANKVYFDCHPRLQRIFKHSFPEVEVHGTRKEEFIDWVPVGALDYKLAIGSLPRFYPGEENEPYLTVPDMPQAKAGGRLQVGISWFGGKKKTRTDLRSLSLDALLPILKLDCDFHSLQYTPEADNEVLEFTKQHGIPIKHDAGILRAKDYALTMRLVDSLDLVISVNTSIVHLCGAMGKQCWTLTPSKPAWRYQLAGFGMPFYGDHVTQYRQHGTDWGPTIQQIAEDLQCLLS